MRAMEWLYIHLQLILRKQVMQPFHDARFHRLFSLPDPDTRVVLFLDFSSKDQDYCGIFFASLKSAYLVGLIGSFWITHLCFQVSRVLFEIILEPQAKYGKMSETAFIPLIELTLKPSIYPHCVSLEGKRRSQLVLSTSRTVASITYLCRYSS